MQVLHLIDTDGLYGAERVVLDLMQHLNSLGLHNVLGSIGGDRLRTKPIEVEARRLGLVVKKFPMKRGFNFIGGLKILGYAKTHGFDVLHSHSYKANIIVGLLPGLIRRIPFVATLHGWKPPRTVTAQWIQAVERWGIHKADRVIAVHASLAAEARLRHVPKERIRVVQNGIRSTCDREYGDSARRMDPVVAKEIAEFIRGKFAIAAVGRLSHEKGFDVLIESVYRLRTKGIDAVAVVMGEGAERRALERLVREKELGDSLRLTGYIDCACEYMNMFDAFAMPSTSEGLPLALLQAMAAGVPVVASAVGGIPAVLRSGELGTLVSSGDVQELADALQRIRRNSRATRQSVEAAQQVVLREYRSTSMAEGYRIVYSSLGIRGRGKRRGAQVLSTESRRGQAT